MSNNNINKDLLIGPVEREHCDIEANQTKKMLTIGITLLVVSIIVFLTGLGCLIGGIVSSTPFLIIVGIGLMSGGVLGILIAGLLIGLSKHKRTLQLENENKTLKEFIAKGRDSVLHQAREEIQNLQAMAAEMQEKSQEITSLKQKLNNTEVERQELEESLLFVGTELEISKEQNLTMEQDLKVQQKFVFLTEERVVQLEEERKEIQQKLEELEKLLREVAEGSTLPKVESLGLGGEEHSLKQAKTELKKTESQEKQLRERVGHLRASIVALNINYLAALTRLREVEAALEKIKPETVLAQAQREIQREALITEREKFLKQQADRLSEQASLLIEKERILIVKQQELDCKEDNLRASVEDERRRSKAPRVLVSPRSYSFPSLAYPSLEVIEEASSEDTSGSEKESKDSE